MMQRNNWLFAQCAVWLILATAAFSGCDSSDSSEQVAVKKPTGGNKKKNARKKSSKKPKVKRKTPNDRKEKPDPKKPQPDSKKPKPKYQELPGSLADILKQGENLPEFGSAAAQKKMKIDEQRVAANRIRKLTSKYLTLYTDLPAGNEIDELPKIFDLAVPQWCEYFQIDLKKVEKWHMTSFLMHEKERFQNAGLLPDYLPQFLYGFQFGHEFWVYEQKSDYYRRHLLLHEGTHAFMAWHLGGTGPPWYSEGMAELLGTHRWQDGKLQLKYFPKDRSETPLWGRVKIVQDDFQNQRGKTLTQVMQYDNTAHRQVAPYGWSWAAATFFDNHPDYRQEFRQLRLNARNVTLDFSKRFYEKLKDDWPSIAEQWQLFVADMDYGYNVAKAAVTYKQGSPLPAEGTTATIQADRAWQSTGILLEKGKTYSITASGRYQVANDPKPWWCQANGVTIQYYRGKPLGMLMAAVRNDDWNNQTITPLALPQPIGLSREITLNRAGTLYLRINEFPGSLDDNSGELTVRVIAK